MLGAARLLALLILVYATSTPAVADEVADAAYRVFEEKCARCHGPDTQRPKGGFGAVLDLAQLAGNPDHVVRREPDTSPLFQLVSAGEMPPPKAREAPLDPSAVETIRAWIEAGAPPSTLSQSAENGQIRRDPGPHTPARFVGQFHPAVVHFPVALLMAAALAQFLALVRRSPSLASTAHFCLTLGALGTVGATVTGWLWATIEGYDAPVHRWFGVATTCFALATWIFATRARRGARPVDRWTYHVVLVLTLALVIYTGHQGGTLTHGPDRLWIP